MRCINLLKDTAIIDFIQLKALYHEKVIDSIIIPRENAISQLIFLVWFKPFGINFNDVYLTNRFLEDGFNFEPYLSSKYLPYLEFHIADQCNLNCKYCEHYSGLVDKEVFPVYEKI